MTITELIEIINTVSDAREWSADDLSAVLDAVYYGGMDDDLIDELGATAIIERLGYSDIRDLPGVSKLVVLIAQVANMASDDWWSTVYWSASEQLDEALSDADDIIRGTGDVISDIVESGSTPWIIASVVGFSLWLLVKLR